MTVEDVLLVILDSGAEVEWLELADDRLVVNEDRASIAVRCMMASRLAERARPWDGCGWADGG